MTTAATLIRELGLSPHPEGGHYRETYRATERISADALPGRYGAPRDLATAIYYLLEAGEFSALHRVQSDELFHFYSGAPAEILTISPAGDAAVSIIGTDAAAGERPQFLVPAGTIQAIRPKPASSDYVLLGATVSPGFDFSDFTLLSDAEVFDAFPALKPSPFAELIHALAPRNAG